MIEPGSRVALVRKPAQTGKVQGRIIDGMAYVRWDVGGAHSVHVDDLVPDEGTTP